MLNLVAETLIVDAASTYPLADKRRDTIYIYICKSERTSKWDLKNTKYSLAWKIQDVQWYKMNPQTANTSNSPVTQPLHFG